MDFLQIFFGFFEIFGFFLDFFWGGGSKVTTKSYQGYYWAPKIDKKNGPEQHIKLSFCARRAKDASAEGQSPPQELDVGPRSWPLSSSEILKKEL